MTTACWRSRASSSTGGGLVSTSARQPTAPTRFDRTRTNPLSESTTASLTLAGEGATRPVSGARLWTPSTGSTEASVERGHPAHHLLPARFTGFSHRGHVPLTSPPAPATTLFND